MVRSIYRALAMGSLAAVMVLAAPHSNVLAEDEPAPAPAAAAGIQWVQGWEAGTAQAKKDGKLIFLYFGRHAPK